eukprot:IDg8987t1
MPLLEKLTEKAMFELDFQLTGCALLRLAQAKHGCTSDGARNMTACHSGVVNRLQQEAEPFHSIVVSRTSSRHYHNFHLRPSAQRYFLLESHYLDRVLQAAAEFCLLNALDVPEICVDPTAIYVKEHVVVQETPDSTFLVSKLQAAGLLSDSLLMGSAICHAALLMRGCDHVQVATRSHHACRAAKGLLEQALGIVVV